MFPQLLCNTLKDKLLFLDPYDVQVLVQGRVFSFPGETIS